MTRSPGLPVACLTIALACVLVACTPTRPPTLLEFVVVRHAEKATDDPLDPTLTAAGAERAATLARLLGDERIVAAYATRYQRTQLTAAPAARDAGVEVRRYDAGQPAKDFAARLRATHSSGTVLVVGHSNTAPDIAAALCNCDVAPMAETEYDRLQRIVIDGAGTARLLTTRY